MTLADHGIHDGGPGANDGGTAPQDRLGHHHEPRSYAWVMQLSESGTRVAIIVDDLDPGRRRRCFWEEQLESIPYVQFELVSLLKNMEERKFFNVYAFDVVIFNWCVLDGALMYASDRVQDIVEFYDDHFARFVQMGGVLIMENQPKRWRPVQRAYDVLLAGDVTVISRDRHFFGSKVIVNPRARQHPVLRHLPPVLHSSYSHSLEESWFPPGSTSARSIQELHPTKVYSGAFLRWGRDWIPALYTEENDLPVMLLKADGLGLWVVTTMYLASSNIKELIESLVVGARKNIVSIHRYHTWSRRARILEGAGLLGALLILGLGVYGVLTTGIIGAGVPYGDTVFGNIVITIVTTVAASILAFLIRRVRQSMRTVFNR